MGRVHKKKLAEYAENEKQLNNSTLDAEDGGSNDVDVVVAVDVAAAAAAVANKANGDSGEEKTTAAAAKASDKSDVESIDDDKIQTEKGAESKLKGGRKTTMKRKNTQNVQKKSENAGDITKPTNGNDSGPIKRGRKHPIVAKSKGKINAGERASSKRVANDDEKTTPAKEEEYEVQEIVDHKVERDMTMYLIRWKGYTKNDDTWEPEDTLSCPEAVAKYLKKNSIENKVTAKKTTNTKKLVRGNAVKGGGGTAPDPEKEWEVEKIIDYAMDKGDRVFRIRWKGFRPKHDTWEPEKNLSCKDLIDKFMKRMESQKNLTFKELRAKPKKTKRLANETLPRTNYNNPVARKSKRSSVKKRIFYDDSDEQ